MVWYLIWYLLWCIYGYVVQTDSEQTLCPGVNICGAGWRSSCFCFWAPVRLVPTEETIQKKDEHVQTIRMKRSVLHQPQLSECQLQRLTISHLRWYKIRVGGTSREKSRSSFVFLVFFFNHDQPPLLV